MTAFSFDGSELITRFLKLLFEGLVVACAAFLIPKSKMGWDEILLLGIVAAASFSLLDSFSPAVGASLRSGAGFSMGAGLVGGLPMVH